MILKKKKPTWICKKKCEYANYQLWAPAYLLPITLFYIFFFILIFSFFCYFWLTCVAEELYYTCLSRIILLFYWLELSWIKFWILLSVISLKKAAIHCLCCTTLNQQMESFHPLWWLLVLLHFIQFGQFSQYGPFCSLVFFLHNAAIYVSNIMLDCLKGLCFHPF